MFEAELDRSKIVEARKLRRKEKRQINKQQKVKVKELEQFGNVKTVSPEFFNICLSNDSVTEKYNQNKTKESIKINISELIVKKVNKEDKKVDEKVTNYAGNKLDSNQPVRFVGKHRDVSKSKRISKIKREKQELTNNIPPKKYLDYGDNTKSKQLDDCTEKFIKEIVVLQEKLYKKDAFKGDIKRKYIVGFHELKKYLVINKVKLLVLAGDMKVTKESDVLHAAIVEIIELAAKNNVPYVVALKRRKLGQLTLKFLPVSCIGILNYDGANGSFKDLIEDISLHKKLFQDNIEDMNFLDQLTWDILEKLQI